MLYHPRMVVCGMSVPSHRVWRESAVSYMVDACMTDIKPGVHYGGDLDNRCDSQLTSGHVVTANKPNEIGRVARRKT